MIKLVKHNIKTDDIKPKKILLISDTHSDVFYDIDEIIYNEKPDFVLLCGDIVDKSEVKDDWNDILFWLKQISQKIPVYASLGNHDVRYAKKENVISKLTENNVIVLDNDFVKYDDIFLYGYTPQIFEEDVYPNNFPEERNKTICLSHRPNDFYETNLINEEFFLTVSGHAHGGQWRLFNRGLYAPQQGFFPKYTSGFYFNNKLFVTRGLGNGTPLPRINNLPEVVILNIG
jgi:predicted MPP superfamily phosphohydrolase